MPDYRKKHRSRFSMAPTPKKTKVAKKEPVMENERETRKSSHIRVVKGKKLEQQRKTKILLGFVGIVLVLFVVLQTALPAGVFEHINNAFSLFGTGSYPVELESSDTLNVVSRGSYYYVLSDTKITAYSNSGKELFSYVHGFEKPVLKSSSTRALVFNQGGNDVLIFDLKELKFSFTTEKPIVTAAISDSGVFGVVTDSDNYASAVSIYSKSKKMIYEWYSSEGTVNNLAISPNGKKIAVSAFTSEVGHYDSKLNILKFDSADAVFSKEYGGTLIYALDTYNSGGISLLTSNGFEYIKWSNYKLKKYSNEYSVSMFRSTSNANLVVFNRENDKTDNRIAIFNSRGDLKREVEFSGILNDIQISRGNIYCLTDTEVFLLNDEGEILRQAESGFGGVRIAVVNTNSVAVITDNKIEKVKLEQVKK